MNLLRLFMTKKDRERIRSNKEEIKVYEEVIADARARNDKLGKLNDKLMTTLDNQAALHAFMDDPDNIKKAAEGSMTKRQAISDELDKIDYLITTRTFTNLPGYTEDTLIIEMRLKLEEKAKAAIQNLILDARIDEQSHTQADIDGNVEYWPNGVTVMSQIERIAELQSQRDGDAAA